jgi:hypothetical protein
MTTALSTRLLVAVTAALFFVVLAFLAGRVHAGADPTQVTTPASNVTQSDPAPTGNDGNGADPSGVPGAAPPGYAPDQGGGVLPDQGGNAVPDADPPATYAS